MAKRPQEKFDPRPFASQTKVSFEAPSTVVYEKKFDTALRASQMEQHYDRVGMSKATVDDRLTCHLKNYPTSLVSHDVSAAAHARIMLHLFSNSESDSGPVLKNRKIPERTRHLIDLAFSNIEIQTSYLHKKNLLPSKQMTMKDFKAIRHLETQDTTYLNVLYDYADWLIGVINASNAMYADYYHRLEEKDYITDLAARNLAHYDPIDLTISWSHGFCVISHSGYNVLLPKSYILMLHNKASDLISIIQYAKLARHSSMPSNFVQLVKDVSVELWHIVVEYGQNGFSVCKCLEALASAETLCQIERWDNDEFLKVVTRDMQADTGYEYKTSTLRYLWKNQNPAVLHELACLSKIAGHPLVDIEGGVQSIHKYTTEEYILNYDKINECTCYAKQNYIRNYILRYGKWPAHEISSPVAPDALKYSSLHNTDPEGYAAKRKYGEITVSDYNFVELMPDQKFNRLENVIPHLKDKTISACRSHVVKKYINQQDIKTSWSDTRLLLYYLLHSGDDTDHTSFLEDYSRGVPMDEFMDYLVIRIVPKEKEMKIKFRGFGCTTFQNRMLFLAQEKTAMAYLDLFCDEQAMTLSELDLVKRLFAFRCLVDAYPQHEILYVMVDASKWNNHFRRETTDKVMASTLDRIYDTKVFGRTHEKYQKTLFYVPDGDTTYAWDGQDGGVEGLNQDTWVIVYIAQIKTALSGMDLKYHVLCKGDDLRLAVMIPRRDGRADDMAATKQIIMVRLAETAKDMGHDIKILDSYGSSRYFNFSKNASVDRIELPQVLRKIQKCYGATNAFLPTIDEYIGSTFSNAHSACRVTTNVLPCFFVALTWSYYYLLTDDKSDVPHKDRRQYRAHHGREDLSVDVLGYAELSDAQLVALLLVPSSCGGFPIIHLHNMIVRAESDLFPAFIDLMAHVKFLNKKEMYSALVNFLYFDSRKKTTWKPLYMDMYALPLLKPETPSFVLRSAMIDPLRNMTTSTELVDLFDLIDDAEGSSKIIKCLDSCATCPAKIFSVVYAGLPEAILSEILRKFETARSVMELLILRKGRKHSIRIIRKVLRADIEVNQWRIARLHNVHSEFARSALRLVMPCPAETAYNIRKEYWGKPIDGITMPPMSHLVGFCTIAQAGYSHHIRANHFTLHVDKPTAFLPRAGNNYHFGVGRKRPFLGHRTGTGTVNPLLHLVEKDKFLSNLRNLAELASWIQTTKIDENGVEVTSNMYEVIRKIVKLYTAEDLQSFAPFLGSRRSGTVAHHIRTRHFRESIVPNSLSNVYQFVEGESNTHSKFFGDHGHYWINFLQILCHGIAISTWELNTSSFFTTPESVWVYTEDCKFCMRLVEEDPIVVDLSLIKRVKFPQLEMIKMGSEAKDILKESLNIAKTRRYNLEGNALELSIEEATLGTLKMLVEMSIETAIRLTDRFSQHPGSRAGALVMRAFAPKTRRRIIGQRELSCLDNNTLCRVIPFLITQLMLKHLNRRALSKVPDSLHSIPPNHLPWFELVYELSRVGRLQHLVVGIAELADRFPTYLTFKPEQVTAYLGVLSIQAIGGIYDTLPLVLLSDYEVSDIHRHLRDYLFVISWQKFIQDIQESASQDDRLESVIHAIVRDHVIDSVVFHTEHSEHLAASGEYKISEFFDNDDVDEALQTLESADNLDHWRKVLGYRHILFTSHARTAESDVYDLFELDPSLFFPNFNIWIDAEEIKVISTTSWACLSTLRESGQCFREDPRRLEDYNIGQGLLSDVWRQDDVRSRDVLSIPLPSENPIDNSPILVQPIIREEDRLPDVAHLNRPFGAHNATVNHLILIFESIGISPSTDFSGLSLCAMGDGIGNGTLFFSRFGYRMRIIFTTAPDNQMLHISPVVALEQIARRNHVLYNQHLQQGIWDLRDPHTFIELESLYHRHDIYFCDAEPPPDQEGFDEVYYNVCNFFIATRKEGAVLILQIQSTSTIALGKCLTFLAMHCTNSLLLRPASLSRPYTYYIAAFGQRRAAPYTDSRLTNIMPRTATMIRSYLASRASLMNATRSSVSCQLTLRGDFPRVPTYRLYIPPLWVSSMSKSLGTSIEGRLVAQMVTESSGTYNYWEISGLDRLNTLSQMRYIRDDLDLTDPGVRPVHAAAYFSVDYQANRIIKVQRYLLHCGFNWALILFKRGILFIPERSLKEAYMDVYMSLPYRDKIIDPDEGHMYHYTTTLPNGLLISYWSNFMDGVVIVQQLSGWLHAIRRETRAPRD